MLRRLPAALVMTFAVGAAISLGWPYLVEAMLGDHADGAIMTVALAESIAHLLMIVAGALAMRELAVGRRRAAVLAVATVAYAVVHGIGFTLAVWIEMVGDPERAPLFDAFERVATWLEPAIDVGLMVAIAAVGLRRGRRGQPIALALVVVATLLQDQVLPWYEWLPRSLAVRCAAGGTIAVTLALAVLGLAAGGVAARGVGWAPAARGLGRAATGLAIRIGLTATMVPLVMISFELHLPAPARWLMISIPAASAAVGAIALVGLLQSCRADADGAPRLRIAGAASAVALVAVFDGLIALIVWRGVGMAPWLPLGGLSDAVAYGVPAIGLVGTFAFLSALAAIGDRVGHGAARKLLAVAGLLLAAVAALGAWLPRLVREGDRGQELVLWSLVLVVVAVGTVVRVVALTRRLAATLGNLPAMPAAIARNLG